ncbi:glycosyltransferase family 4 protein [Chitinophaga sp. G-6-1-13]|uniref:Glycosyltransferase family 4 protein n=1 Tax=Chitinophaga fulva TaxID=2728842 RepID=A0A848GIY7_9BACT|nr:hypothetical protein [Chitinophaga fulva]NML35838.1 glycosyltransferase family 4 protein [Chitinophaga fulva]
MDELRILLIGEVSNFHIENLAKALRKYSTKPLMVDMMCTGDVSDNKLNDLHKIFNNVYFRKEGFFLKKFRNAGPLYTLFNIISIIKLSTSIKRRYTVAEIHYLDTFYAYIVPFIRRKTDNIFACLWGSDYYQDRAAFGKRQKKEFDYLLHYVDKILVGTSQMSSEVAAEYPALNGKISEIRFGSPVIDRMEEFLQTANATKIKERLGIDPECIVISAGHNGAREQNHLQIIDALEQTVKELGNTKIHVLFPVTYPADENYRNEIRQWLQHVSFPVTIFDKFLAEEQVMEIRVVSDVFIHIQSQDAFSAAMLEYFYAGTVVLNGAWLKYPELDTAGMVYPTVENNTVADLVNALKEILSNMQVFKEKCKGNRNIAYNLKSWEANVYKWLGVYDQLNASTQ